MSFEVTVVNEKNFPCVKEYTRYYSEILSSAEKVLSLDKNYVLSAIFVDDEEIHQINRDYRNIDRPTDVISFASMDDAEDFEWEMDEIELGDIFINVDAVARQAVEYGHPASGHFHVERCRSTGQASADREGKAGVSLLPHSADSRRDALR